MDNLWFRDDVTVQLVDHMGSDQAIIMAMLVSTMSAEAREAALDIHKSRGRIDFLMKNRHGTPFEHNSMMFYIEAPIFVFREFHRHRVGWSYNEVSGRYRELDGVFYVPGFNRPMIQTGKPGAYTFIPPDEIQYEVCNDNLRDAYIEAWNAYKRQLDAGIAKEVARMCLPVGIFSAMYATCNARSLMHFLSLRTHSDESKFPSFPMREIEMVAEKMENHFSNKFPLTYASWKTYGRVAP